MNSVRGYNKAEGGRERGQEVGRKEGYEGGMIRRKISDENGM